MDNLRLAIPEQIGQVIVVVPRDRLHLAQGDAFGARPGRRPAADALAARRTVRADLPWCRPVEWWQVPERADGAGDRFETILSQLHRPTGPVFVLHHDSDALPSACQSFVGHEIAHAVRHLAVPEALALRFPYVEAEMSAQHPIMAVTGSSGSGTTSVTRTIEQILRREGVRAAMVVGDAFHRYDRAGMQRATAEAERAGNPRFCHFSPEANLLPELEQLFSTYGSTGAGDGARVLPRATRTSRASAARSATGSHCPRAPTCCTTRVCTVATSTTRSTSRGTRTCSSESCRSSTSSRIQKLHRDRATRGHSQEEVVATILRRMPDYIDHICPQFSRTDVNFQRVPHVDTSNPFIARHIPTLDESTLVIRFRDPHGIDFSYLLAMLHDSFMSRPNTIVVPGGKMELAMQADLHSDDLEADGGSPTRVVSASASSPTRTCSVSSVGNGSGHRRRKSRHSASPAG